MDQEKDLDDTNNSHPLGKPDNRDKKKLTKLQHKATRYVKTLFWRVYYIERDFHTHYYDVYHHLRLNMLCKKSTRGFVVIIEGVDCSYKKSLYKGILAYKLERRIPVGSHMQLLPNKCQSPVTTIRASSSHVRFLVIRNLGV
ncbi:hypothetical protein EPI10_029304 [Gossypium australe]|uniref:Uncharacterized protein n=1 Tax=Gossypium australe TaxID=47621 RepID=A0A5B6V1B6_9ROSI|nr:hypothetical protein EPI10_029304 [Gossypium australe]